MGFFGSKVVIPPPSGPHSVGTTRYDVLDAQALDPPAPRPGPPRVPVQAWYPAQGAPARGEPYLDDELRAALSALTRVPKFLLPKNPSWSTPNASPVPGRWPVLIFNHGFASFQKQSTSLLEELASHGYLVLSVGHPFESLSVTFAKGEVVRWRPELPAWQAVAKGLKDLERNVLELSPLLEQARAAPNAAALREVMSAVATRPGYVELVPVLAQWVRDTRLVLDTLGQLDEGALAAPLRGLLDLQRVGVFGHSLGGMVAGQLAMADPRVGAGLSFDGAQLPPAGTDYLLRAPFCFVYADTTKVGKAAATTQGINDALLATAPKGSCSLTITGAAHLNFTDMNNVSSMARALGQVDRGEMARLLRALTRGFFDHHLKGLELAGFEPSAKLTVHWPS